MTTTHLLLRGVHIAMGLTGLLSGAISMGVRKGSSLHEVAGRVFLGSMLVMAASGGIIAAFIRPNAGNAMGALLTIYLVITAWLTVWRAPQTIGIAEPMAAGLGMATVAAGAMWALKAANAANGRVDGYPPALFLIFALIALIASIFDVRMIAMGGVRGLPRLTRHLWRMCLAMFIATSSFFLGAASRRFPAVVRESGLLPLPVVLVLAALGYWLVRVWLLPRLRKGRAPAFVAGHA
jgi:uncharacterized membrane protein